MARVVDISLLPSVSARSSQRFVIARPGHGQGHGWLLLLRVDVNADTARRMLAEFRIGMVIAVTILKRDADGSGADYKQYLLREAIMRC